METLIESMTRVNLGDFNVFYGGSFMRVWREERPELGWNFARTRDEIHQKIELNIRGVVGMREMAEAVLAMDRVNAVEIVDSHGQGMVAYKDWP